MVLGGSRWLYVDVSISCDSKSQCKNSINGVSIDSMSEGNEGVEIDYK